MAGICLLPAAAGAQPLTEPAGPSPGSAAIRSLVLPGWGQAANGSWWKAGLFGGAYAGFMAWGISQNQDVQDAVGRLNAADTEEERQLLSIEVNNMRSSRNAKFWFAGVTALLAMTDAFVDAHLKGFDERIDADVGFVPVETGGAPALGLTLVARFDRPLGRR